MSAQPNSSARATVRRRVPGAEKRTIRALHEPLAVVEQAPGLFTVYSHEGTPYTVDPDTESCTCPDAEYNDPLGGCKHVRVVSFWVGERELPHFVDREALGFHLRRYLDELDEELWR